MADIMVDLETLGSIPGSVILSIGAVVFNRDKNEIKGKFLTEINTQSCLTAGLTKDADTIAWWGRQSDAARKILVSAEQSETTLIVALENLSIWMKAQAEAEQDSELRVWGNGASFDNALLTVAFRKVEMELPWKFRNDRCFRTYMAEAKRVKQAAFVKRQGTHHDALDDAVHQAKVLLSTHLLMSAS